MAGNSVDYIIRLLPDTSELKKKLNSNDILNFSDISDIKNLIIDEVKKATSAVNKEAPKIRDAIQKGLDVDTSELKKQLEFVSGLMSDLEKTSNPMESWTKRGKGLYDTFINLQNSVSVLSGDVKSLQDSLGNLNTSFETFKKSYQSFRPTEFASVGKEIGRTIDLTAKLESSVKRMGLGKLDEARDKLQKFYDELTHKGKAPDFSTWGTDKLLSMADQLDKKWDQIEKKMTSENRWEYTKEEILSVSRIMSQLIEINKYLPNDKKILTTYQYDGKIYSDVKDYQKQIDEVIIMIEKRLQELDDKIKKSLGESFSEIISKQLSDIKLSLTLPKTDDFVPEVNKFIAELNTKSKSFDKIKLMTDIVNDSSNVIEDKTKQAYKNKNGEHPASNDANTDDLAVKTSDRFERIISIIDEKQQKILDNTNTWRENMIKAMKIASNDLEFEFGWDQKVEGGAQQLKNAIQTYFDMPGNEINVNVKLGAVDEDAQYGSNLTTSGGGIITINPNNLEAIIKSVLFGTPVSNTSYTRQKVTSTDNEITEKKEAIVVTKSYVTQLDASSDSVKSFISVLKDFVNILYGKRVSKGAKAIGDFLNAKGLDLKSIKNGASDEDIARQLTTVFLEQDEMGYAKGSTIADVLEKRIKSNNINSKSKNGKIINLLPKAFTRLLSSNGVITETESEWGNRIHGLDTTKFGIDAGRKLALLNRARYPFKPGTKRKLNVDGGMWDINNDFENVIDELQQERKDITDQLTKEKNELAQLKASKPKGKSSTYKEDYETAKQLAKDVKEQRQQAEKELESIQSEFNSATDATQKNNISKKMKEAQVKVANLKKQELEANNLERETLGALQNAKRKAENLVVSINKKEQLLAAFDALDKIKKARATLGNNPTEEAMSQFKAAGVEFYEKSRDLFNYLSAKFKFKGLVGIEGQDELIPINTPQDALKIPNGAKIVYVEPYVDHSNSTVGSGFVGSTQHRNSNYRKANGQERRFIAEGSKADYLGNPMQNKKITEDDIVYKKFRPIKTNALLDISGRHQHNKIQQLDAEIESGKTRLSELDKEISEKEQQINELTQKNNKISNKRKQSAQTAVSEQKSIVERAQTQQSLLEDQLNEKEAEIKQALSEKNRIQNELSNISELDIDRTKNAIRSQIKDLENWEPYWRQNINRIQPTYNLASDTLQYANSRVQKRQSELSQANASGDAQRIADATSSLNQAIAERTKAQAEFNQITEELNKANNALDSNIAQRKNLQERLDNTDIETVRNEKQGRLDVATAKVQTLENEKNQLLSKVEQAKENYRIVSNELDVLMGKSAYSTPKALELAKRDKNALEVQKRQLAQNILNKEQEKQDAVILSKKLELQNQYNTLKERSLQLQSEINQMSDSDDGMSAKKEELKNIDVQLDSIKTKLNDLGGIIVQDDIGIIPEKKHSEGLKAANEYQKILDIAYQLQTKLENSISEYNEKERQVNKFGAGQYDVRKAVSKKQQELRNEFLDSDYVKVKIHELEAERDTKLSESLKVFNKRITDSMINQGLNPANKSEMENFIRDSGAGKSFQEEENKIWEEYKEKLNQTRKTLLSEFEKGLNSKNGIVSAKFKVNKDGKWINQTQKYDVKDNYLRDINAQRQAAKDNLSNLTLKIADIKHQKNLAMTYGSVSESEITHSVTGTTHQFGQLSQVVTETTRSFERLSDNAQTIASEENSSIIDADNYATEGGILGAIRSTVENAFGGSSNISDSVFAIQETLNAIYALLGGSNTSNTERVALEEELATINKKLEGEGLSKNQKKEELQISSKQIMSDGMEARIARANALSKAGLKVGRSRLLLNGDEAFEKMLSGDKIKDVIQNIIWPKIVQQLKAAGLTNTEQFDDILSSIADKSSWKSKKASSWIHFATPDGKFDGPITKKAYGSFTDIGKLSSELINKILDELAAKGFKGQIKIPSDITGFYDTDQIVGHAVDDNSFRILVDTFQKLAKDGVLSSIATGVDANTKVLRGRNGASFTQLIEEIYEAAPGQTFTVQEIKSIITSIVKNQSGKFDQELVKPIVDDFINQRITSEKTDYQKAVEIVRNAIGNFSLRTSNDNKAEKYNSLEPEVKDAANVLRTTKEGVTKEGTNLLEKMYKLREAANKVAQKETNTNQLISEEDDESLDPELLAKVNEGLLGVQNRIDTIENRLAELENIDTPEAKNEKDNLQKELVGLKTTVKNTSDTIKQLKGNTKPNDKSDLLARKTEIESKLSSSSSGGIVGIMRTELAKENTLQKVLSTLGEIAKKNTMSSKPNSAQDLLEQFRRMLESDAWEGRERVAYMDLATGSMSNAITGDDKAISAERLRILREAYVGKMDMNAQVHTHANEDDPYFSPQDLQQFGVEFANGITKQILLSKNNMTVLDMTDVKDINGLLDALAKTEQNFESLAATADKFGAKYTNKAFDAFTPQDLVKMLGIKGVESKLNQEETRESSRAGVAEEDSKEAAKMLQESTGRAIKTTVQRVGVELETLVEKTDTKGNKTWTSEISNKYQKAMEATNKRIIDQNLGNVFGSGTDAANALTEYEAHYSKLLDLVTKFKSASKEERKGLQSEINALLPTFNEVEKKLISLIERKDRFIGDDKVVATFGATKLKSTRKSLEAEARKRYGGKLNPGSNVAFGGYKRGQGSGQLYVDVLKDGTIKQYVLEVDRATGQVKEYVAAENALANAFQNVNKAMKQNEFVLADIAIGNGPKKQAEWMANTSSPQLDEYKKAFKEMQNYTVQLWNSSKSPTQQQLDYLMQLSEKVIVLGKNLQKTSGEFKNFWAQNPDNVFGIDFNADDTVRSAMERYAQINASANTSKYEFESFDNNTLKYKLTDVEGNIRNVTMMWDELYQKVAMISDRSVSALDPLVKKIEDYKQTIADAKNNFYLLDTDDAKFNKALEEVSALEQKIKDGTASFKELEAVRRKAIGVGAEVNKLANKNAKLYIGTNEINSAKRQRDKILGTTSIDLESKDQPSIFKNYIGAYDALIAKHQKYANQNKLNNPKIQEELRQQAAGVQKLGRQFLSAATEAEKLKEYVDNSGTYINRKGEEKSLSGIRAISADEAANMEATMRAYAKSVLGADLETVKFNSRTQTLTGVLRQNNRIVSDMVVKYNKATESMYLFQQQERESLSGLPGILYGLKEKGKAILQYLASVTSIYRVWGTLKQGITYVKEIDSALTELKKVTDETEETYDRFLNTAAKTADKVGSTIKEVVSSTADWARLGYSLEDAAKLAENTSILLNVSEFQSIDEATKALTSTLQAFSYTADESLKVVDVLNEVGNNFAISSDGIATALQDSASSLVAANNSYQQAVALIAAANRVVNLCHIAIVI